MIRPNNITHTSQLISAVWKSEGLLKTVENKEMTFWVCTPLPSNRCEVGFEGPVSEAYFEKLQESLSGLKSAHNAQLVFSRRLNKTQPQQSLFPNVGLLTTLYILEDTETGKDSSLKQSLTDLGFTLRPGSKPEYTGLIKSLLGQSEQNTDLILPNLVWEERYLKSDTQYLKVASLTDLPLSTWNNCFESLFHTADEFVCSIKVQVTDKEKSKKSLSSKRRISHALSAHKPHELSDLESNSNLSASEEMLIRVTQGKECLMNMNLAVIMNDDSLAKLTSRFSDLIAECNSSSGAGFYLEGIGALPVLKSHMPASKTLPVRELPLLSGNLVHMMPIFLDHSRHQSSSSLKFVSRSAETSHLNYFAPSNLNFNAFVCGASGSGKSFLMNSTLASFKSDYPNGSIVIFDVGGSYRKLAHYLDGSSFDLNTASATKLIASALQKITIEPSGICKTILENICGAGPHITHSHKVAMEDLLQACSGASFSISLLSNEALEHKDKIYQDIAHWLKPFLHWDQFQGESEAAIALDSKVQVFDFKELEGNPLLQRLSILILTNNIWSSLKNNSSEPTMIVFDEVWKFFSQASSFLEEMYRTFRKYRAGIVSITQNLSDYGDSAFAKLVITNSFHKVLLQGAANSELLKSSLDLNESDVARFLSVTSKKNEFSEFWVGTPQFSQIMRLYPSPELFKIANSEAIQKEDV